jgi:hypothetical protein
VLRRLGDVGPPASQDGHSRFVVAELRAGSRSDAWVHCLDESPETLPVTFAIRSRPGCHPLRCCQAIGFYSAGIALASEGVNRERSQ